MRPTYLTVEGLTCFKDRQELDLSSLDLFAISGPTGSGKSSLLDAMIFALYGEVPRVSKQDRSEMISAARARVSVRLDFELGTERYRIVRTLRRSGQHQVQLERHTGQEVENLADLVRTAEAKVVQILGLEAAAFLQAVVLPQGQFAKFLKDRPNERRSMLRSLLRLNVYEQMRQQAWQIQAEKQNRVNSLQGVLDDEYQGVDRAALEALEARHGSTVRGLGGLRRKRQAARRLRDRVREQHGKTEKLRELQASREKLAARGTEMADLRRQIDAARRAAPLISHLEEARRAEDAAADARIRAEQAAQELEEARREHQEHSAACEVAQEAARDIPELHRRRERLHQVIGRLPEARQLRSLLARQAGDIETVEEDLSDLHTALEQTREAQEEARKAIEEAQRASAEARHDPELAALLEPLRSRAIELGGKRRTAMDAGRQLRQKRGRAEELAAELASHQKDMRAANEAAEAARRAFQAAEDGLHRAQRLGAVSHLRQSLEPGQPCPVCEQTIDSAPAPRPDPELEGARDRCQRAKQQLDAAEATARQADRKVTELRADLRAAQGALEESRAESARLREEIEQAEAGLRALLGARLDEGERAEEWIEARAASLAESQREHSQAKERLQAAEWAHKDAADDEADRSERIGEKEASLERLREDRRATAQRLSEIDAEIAAVSESADPAAEAEDLAETIAGLERRLEAARHRETATQSRLSAAKAAATIEREAADKAGRQAAERARSRDEAILAAGFADAAAVRAAHLDAAGLAERTDRARAYEQEIHTLDQQVASLRQDLGEVRISDGELAAAEDRARHLDSAVEERLGEQKTLEEQIGRLQGRLERSREIRRQLAAEKKDLGIYRRLAGDLRGDRFQAFVLEEAFSELVRGASSRLFDLTMERYSLRFEGDDILVVDHDNADEARISDTLSGGETFLASLSLALELSNQVQRAAGAVHLDSLFIDEGFGTLDPDTLALVSETIQSLQVGGRMVGVITHIPELRDEFAQQILVTRHHGFSTAKVRGVADGA